MNKATHGNARRNIAGIMKAIGLLALLLILMLWLSGTFFSKMAPGPPLPRAKPPATQTHRVERRIFPMTIDQQQT